MYMGLGKPVWREEPQTRVTATWPSLALQRNNLLKAFCAPFLPRQGNSWVDTNTSIFSMHEYNIHAKSSSKVISGGHLFVAVSHCWWVVRHCKGAVSVHGVASPNRCSYQDDTYCHVERQKTWKRSGFSLCLWPVTVWKVIAKENFMCFQQPCVC